MSAKKYRVVNMINLGPNEKKITLYVDSITQAIQVINTLADAELQMGETMITTNTFDLEVYGVALGWESWTTPDGDSIQDVMRALE